MKDFISEHLVTIISYVFGGGSIVGWILERRKKKTEALRTMQEAYNTFTEDSLLRYEELKKQVLVLREELLEMSKQLSEEKRKYYVLEDKHNLLEYEHNKIKKQLEDVTNNPQ